MLNFCCCGAKVASVSGERYLSTGILPGDSVVILLNQAKMQDVRIENEGKERSIERCLKNAMTYEGMEWKTVSATDFRRRIFPGKKYEDTPHTIEDFSLFIRDERSRREVEKLGIRYLVVVDTNTYNHDEDWNFAAQQSMWVVQRSWTRSSSLTAFVIDVRQSAESGAFVSTSSGTAGFVLPFLVIIPLPPIPLLALTEGEACSALGPAVANFLEGKQRTNMERKADD